MNSGPLPPSLLPFSPLPSSLLLSSLLSVLEKQKPIGAGIPCPKFPTFYLEVGIEKTTVVNKFAFPIAGLFSGSQPCSKFLRSVCHTCTVAEGTQAGHFLREAGLTWNRRPTYFSRAHEKVWNPKKAIGSKTWKGNCKIEKCLIKSLLNITAC